MKYKELPHFIDDAKPPKFTINTSAGPLNYITLKQLLLTFRVHVFGSPSIEYIKLVECEVNEFGFLERTFGRFTAETVKNFNLDTALQLLKKEIPNKTIELDQPILHIVEDEVVNLTMNFSNPQYLVRLGARQWAIVDLDSIQTFVYKDRATLVSTVPHKSIIINVKRKERQKCLT